MLDPEVMVSVLTDTFGSYHPYGCLNFVGITLYPLSRSLSVQGLLLPQPTHLCSSSCIALILFRIALVTIQGSHYSNILVVYKVI